jgi:hypothetical protein
MNNKNLMKIPTGAKQLTVPRDLLSPGDLLVMVYGKNEDEKACSPIVQVFKENDRWQVEVEACWTSGASMVAFLEEFETIVVQDPVRPVPAS